MKTITAARMVSLLAAFVWGAVAEYKLALAVGADEYTAALLPLVLDVYGLAAFKAGRTWHVIGALGAMFATQTVSHLLTLGDTSALMVGLTIAVSAIPPAVSLACHRLGVRDEPEPELVKADTITTAGRRNEHVITDEVFGGAADESADWDTVTARPTPEDIERYVAASRAAQPQDDEPDAQDDEEADERRESLEGLDRFLAAMEEAQDGTTEPEKRTPAELAALGRAMTAGGRMTKTDAADELGVSRQWLHTCMKNYPADELATA